MARVTGSLNEDQYAFFYHMSLMSSQNEKCGRQKIEKIKTLILCSSFAQNRAVCEVMWGNMVEPGRPQMAIRHNMAHAHCMLDA